MTGRRLRIRAGFAISALRPAIRSGWLSHRTGDGTAGAPHARMNIATLSRDPRTEQASELMLRFAERTGLAAARGS